MTFSLDKPVVCPVMVGHSQSLAGFIEVLHQAVSGQAQLILVEGEAGVGKSRLITEALLKLETNLSPEPKIFKGRCFEPDRTRPYAPLIDLLWHYQQVEAGRGQGPTFELAKLLPEAATLEISFQPSELDVAKFHQTLADYLFGQVKNPSSILLIEDIHWCDEASLDFFLFLAVRQGLWPVTLIFSYRGFEISGKLRSFLAALDREHRSTEFRLGGLKRDETELMLGYIFEPHPKVPADFLDTLYRLTEGNPFFIEEVLKSLILSGAIIKKEGHWEFGLVKELNIPRTVQVAVQQQTDLLNKPALELVGLSAVVGRRVNFNLLQRLSQISESELVSLFKELIRAQLLVEESADNFVFRHALTRQAIYADLLARERRNLHLKVAKTLEESNDWPQSEKIADLAYHYYEAEIWEKVLEYAPRAGEQAFTLYSPGLAINQYSRAVEAAGKLGISPSSAIYRARGQLNELLGNFEAARSDYTLALTAAQSSGDKTATWQSLLDLGFLWTGRDFEQAAIYFQQALERTKELDNRATLAHTLNRVGNWYLHAEQPQESLGYHGQALAIFQELKDPQGLAETLDLLGTISYHVGDLVKGAAYYRQAIPLFRELENRQGVVSALTMLAFRGSTYLNDLLVSATINLTSLLVEIKEALEIARATEQHSAEAFALLVEACIIGPSGEYNQAQAAALKGLAIAGRIEHHHWLLFGHWVLGALYFDLLSYAQAEDNLLQAVSLAREVGSQFWEQVATAFLVSCYIAEGKYEPAEKYLSLSEEQPIQAAGQMHMYLRQIELAQAKGNSVEALGLLEQLEKAIPHSEEANIPRLKLLKALCLEKSGRVAEAEELLKVAFSTAQDQQAYSLVWRILAAQASNYLEQAKISLALEYSRAAQSLIEKLAANISDQTLRENFIQRAKAFVPELTSQLKNQSSPGGLSRREYEVALQVASGKANRIIALELVLSERTVEKHIENIMLKLDFSSRSQIAVWVVEHNPR